MKNSAKHVCGVLLAVLLLSAAASAASMVLPLSQVKPGMKAKGKSVFTGTTIEDFDADIIGVLSNVTPKRSIILARLSGRGLDQTGVISGMSGSPVYVDGKIIGAVAYSFSYAKVAIAGITPIEEMIAIDKVHPSERTGGAAGVPIKESMSLEDLAGAYRATFAAGRPDAAPAPSAVPVRMPLVLGGFSSWAFERAKPFFAEMGFEAVRAGLLGQTMPAPAPGPASLREGDAVGVQLVSGDLDMSAIGTVTYVDGTKVLAFGHPFYNLGAVEYGMTKAEVLTVVPSLESSFKMASSGPLIGRFTQDRTSGVSGEIGKMPRTIPLNITIQNSPLDKREFKLRLADDKFLTPALVNMCVSSLITGEERAYGNLSLDFDGDVFLDKGQNVHVEDLFSGNYDTAATNLSGLLAAIVYYLNNNEFSNVGIYRIDLNVRTAEEVRLCSLEKVLLDRYEVSPGEKIQIKVFVRTLKEESIVEDISMITPPLPPGTEFQIVVGDAASMQQVERAQYRIQDFTPRSFSQLVRLLGNLRKNNRIYFKVLAPKPGLFLKGEEMPNLPPTLKSMFGSSRALSAAVTELTRSTLSEYQLPIPFVFHGSAVIPVRIRN